MLVSCVMTTYRRFTCVERSIACFLAQTYPDTELIIYNTDVKYPLSLGDDFDDIKNIKVINNNIDFVTKRPYDNTGSIRRDACTFASGELYITWDDDDLFFPWNVAQAVDGIFRTGARAWKPIQSFWKARGGNAELCSNYLEASVVVYLSDVLDAGFRQESGKEHLGWFDKLSSQNLLIEDRNSIPGYCFYWADESEIAGHKQSGTIDAKNNFEFHLINTVDRARRPLEKRSLSSYQELDDFYELLKQHPRQDLVRNYGANK